jgi:cytochrome c oxidase subunit IV
MKQQQQSLFFVLLHLSTRGLFFDVHGMMTWELINSFMIAAHLLWCIDKIGK